MRKPIKRVAVIHDLCTYGKAALTNIIPVLSVMGVEVCPIPTIILSTHTGGFGKPYINQLPDYIQGASKHFLDNEVCFDGIFIGYLGSEKILNATLDFIKEHTNENIFIDPIFGDNGRCYSNFDMDYVNSIRKVIPYGTVITPNYTEACFLTEEEYTENISKEKIERICAKFFKLGAKNIVITSVPNINKNIISMAICEKGIDKIRIIEEERCKESYHGTGDIFTSVIIGELLREYTLEEAVIKAHNFVKECIEVSSEYDYPKREGILLEKKLHLLMK